MNRLIIIGNGFDLAHGLKTSYHDFVLDYLKEACINAINSDRVINELSSYDQAFLYDDQLIKINIKRNYNKHQFIEKIQSLNNFQDFIEFKERKIDILFYFDPLKNGFEKMIDKRWVDFELEYFDVLYKIKNTNNSEKNIIELNNQFDFFKLKLENYLSKQEQNITNNVLIEEYADLFCQKISEDEVDLEKINTKQPSNLLFLNFNYTNTLLNYYQYCKTIISSEINYIHGKLNDYSNKPIFGFGDEIDKRYSEFENERNNDLFKHIKSFNYLQNKNYSNLTRFLDSNKFQVHIYGHSCGLSDRTMFKEIFEHTNCLSIKVFYHQKPDGSDDYTEKTYEIYRHFSDKNNMRKKVVDKEKSVAMPQIV